MPHKNKEVARIAKRRWYLAHREEVIARTAKWQKENAKKYQAWRRANRKKINQWSREWYRRNKKKVVEYVSRWREANPKKRIEQARRYRVKHRVEIKSRNMTYRAKHKERDRLRAEERRRKLKAEVYMKYGNKCRCCGENNTKFLTVDHVSGDGSEHRKTVQGGYMMHVWLKKNGFPKINFQLLCWNCNLGRFYNGGRCPHKEKASC